MGTNPTVERGKLGALIRYHGADSPEADAARASLAEAKIAAYIEKTVAAAPPLSEAQADRLSALLRGGAR